MFLENSRFTFEKRDGLFKSETLKAGRF